MASASSSRPVGRVWHGKIARGVKVELTDSLGVPVVLVSDGTETAVIPVAVLGDLINMLRRAQVALELAGDLREHAGSRR